MTTAKTASAILKRSLAFLQKFGAIDDATEINLNTRGWVKGAYAQYPAQRDLYGDFELRETKPYAKRATCFCAAGLVKHFGAGAPSSVKLAALTALAKTVPAKKRRGFSTEAQVTHYNDDTDTKLGDVKRWFGRAIKKAA